MPPLAKTPCRSVVTPSAMVGSSTFPQFGPGTGRFVVLPPTCQVTLVIDCGRAEGAVVGEGREGAGDAERVDRLGSERERRDLVEVAAGRLVDSKVLGDRDRRAQAGLHFELGKVGVHRLRGGFAPC